MKLWYRKAEALNIHLSNSSFFVIDPDVFSLSHALFLYFVTKNCSADQTRKPIFKYQISFKQSIYWFKYLD